MTIRNRAHLDIKSVFQCIGISIIKTVMRSSYLYYGDHYTGKMVPLYWDAPLNQRNGRVGRRRRSICSGWASKIRMTTTMSDGRVMAIIKQCQIERPWPCLAGKESVNQNWLFQRRCFPLSKSISVTKIRFFYVRFVKYIANTEKHQSILTKIWITLA